MTRVGATSSGVVIDPLQCAPPHYYDPSMSLNIECDTQPPVPDDARLRRTMSTAHVVWKHPGIRAFSATTYFFTYLTNDPEFIFSVSTDGNVWTPVAATVNKTTNVVPWWDQHDYLIDNLFNVNYVKMQWSPPTNPNQTWTPQIGGVRMIH